MMIATDPKTVGTESLFIAILKSIIDGQNGSLIDLCSHEARLTRTLDFESKTFVDILPRNLDEDQNSFVQCDVLGEHEIFNRRYDVATCLDGIEHLAKADGFRLLDRMQGLSEKQILFTPLDPFCLNMTDGPEGHHSLWGPLDVPEFACLLMPNYHESIGIGAFFFWRCANLESEFKRVIREVNSQGVAKFSE